MKSFFEGVQRILYFLHKIQTLLNDFVQVYLLLLTLYFFTRNTLFPHYGTPRPLEVVGGVVVIRRYVGTGAFSFCQKLVHAMKILVDFVVGLGVCFAFIFVVGLVVVGEGVCIVLAVGLRAVVGGESLFAVGWVFMWSFCYFIHKLQKQAIYGRSTSLLQFPQTMLGRVQLLGSLVCSYFFAYYFTFEVIIYPEISIKWVSAIVSMIIPPFRCSYTPSLQIRCFRDYYTLLSCSRSYQFFFQILSLYNIRNHMPPKKKQQKEAQQILWGRPANTLKMGIVGLPNVGKSTTYNVLSNLNVPAENYPFCTIEPNKAVVPVPDERFNKLCEMFKPKSEVSAVLQIVDIAGIVRGASKGEGLGNHFLSNIRDVDGIYHVVRAFEDEEITHTQNSVDPLRDMDIINSELVLKDLEYVTNRLEDLEKVIKRTNPKQAKEEKDVLVKALELLQKNKWVRHGEWRNDEIALLNTHRFITAKSVVYLVNLSAEDFVSKKNKWLKKIKDYIDANVPGEIIPYSAEHERLQLSNNDPNKRTMLPKIIKAGYNALDLIYFFTSGTDQVRCWTIRKLTKAPQAAGVIHTDFEKGFICAEVMRYDDLISLGSEQAVKAEGKYVQKGKDYVVQDGDIIFFRFNVGGGGKK